MEAYVTLQDVANVITFVAPGFVALRTYGIVYAKGEKDFAQLVVLSIICSLPIVAAYNFTFGLKEVASTTAPYVLGLVMFSSAIGLLSAALRRSRVVRKIASRLRFPEPDEDFVKTQFNKLGQGEPVTVKLKNGELFSGTPQGGSLYRAGQPRPYFFSNVAWFDAEKEQWDERPGSIIIDLNDVEYIQTAQTLPED